MAQRVRVGMSILIVLLFGVSSVNTSAGDAPANVAGTWTISVTGGAGNATQTIVLQQDGGGGELQAHSKGRASPARSKAAWTETIFGST